MLSDDAIDKLIDKVVQRQEAINVWVLKLIAKQIDEIGTLSPSSIYSLERLIKTGSDSKLITKRLAELTGKQQKEIRNLIKTVAADAYKDAKKYYDHKGVRYIPFDENIELQNVVTSISKATADTYTNIANATAFMIRDLKNPSVLKPTPLAQAYQSVLDEAIQASQSGVVDYNTAMQRTLKQLINSGLRRVEYSPESGRRYTQRLDTAVRRNLLDGVRAINQGVQDEIGRQFGADGKEISVHINSAPDHEPIQGHQFSNEEYEKLQTQQDFKDADGREYQAIDRAIGTLNCRHFTYSIILGLTEPTYTPSQLDRMIKENQVGYTTPSGKHYTKYECTQEQRRLETEIRYAKEGQIVSKEAGNLKLATQYQIKIQKLLDQYDELSHGAKLEPRYEKTEVPGYVPLKPSEYTY